MNDIIREDAPKDAGRLWYLGRAIQDLEKAEAVYFSDEWYKADGCKMELVIATNKKLNIINPNNGKLKIEIDLSKKDKYSELKTFRLTINDIKD